MLLMSSGSGASLLAPLISPLIAPILNPSPPTPGAFTFTINTENLSAGSSNDDQFCLPLHSVGTYNFDVDWGDSNVDTITTWNQAQVTHTYNTPGIYEITITGTCAGWMFFDNGDGLPIDNLKILNISQWGDLILSDSGDLDSYFSNCANLTITATDVLNLTPTQLMANAFFGCTSLTNIPSITSSDWANVITATSCFQQSGFNQSLNGANFLNVEFFDAFLSETPYNQPINWNIPAAISLISFLAGASSFNQPITLTTSSALTDLSYLLSDNAIFNSAISISNTSAVSSYNGMLAGYSSFNQDLSDLDFSSALSANNMLDGTNMSTTNYSNFLISLASQSTQNNVTLGATGLTYDSSAVAAKAVLTVTRGWTINDGGLV